MKHNIRIFAAITLATLGLASCQKVELNQENTEIGKHSLSFNVSMAEETRTGLVIKIAPTWVNTLNSDINLYEGHLGYLIEGENAAIHVDTENNQKATFSADFNSKFVVTPPSAATKAIQDSEGYRYGGIVARKDGDGSFYIPATQTPDAECLIDPRADFLIGDSQQDYDDPLRQTEIIMGFRRPVALSRLAITNIEGSKVTSVTITSTDDLVGKVALDAIDFASGTAEFTGNGKVLTLSYPGGAAKQGGTFYAYFVSLAGSKNISSVEVKTDQYVYTKTIGKSQKFVANSFLNIALDMTVKEGTTRQAVDPNEPVDQSLKFMRGGSQITSDVFTLGGDAYVAPTLTGYADGAAITYDSSDKSVATVNTSGVVTILKDGQTVISATASAVTGYNQTTISYTLNVNPAPEPPSSQDVVYYKASTINPNYDYIIVSNGYALKNKSGDIDALEVSIVNEKITLTSEDASILWKASVNTGFTDYGTINFANNGSYFYRPTGSSPVLTFGTAINDSSNGKRYVFTYGASNLYNLSIYNSEETLYYLYYDTSAEENPWKFSESKKTVEIFTSRKPQTISFSTASAEYDLNAPSSFTKPALSGDPKTTVTYSSSDESYAAVDSSTGSVTGKKKTGSSPVTITATAAASSDYQSATASYSLTVKDTGSKEKAYVKITGDTIEEGSYLLVLKGNSNYYVFDATNGSSYRTVVTPDDGVIASDEDIEDAVIEVSKGSSNGKYYFKTSEGYLYCKTGSSPYIGFDTEKKSDYEQTVTISGGEVTLKNKGTRSSEYYLGYSSSAFLYTSSSSKFELYLLDDGKSNRNLSFASSKVEKNLGDAKFTNALSGTTTGVSYSIEPSDSKVASVDASTGEVTVLASGTVTIKASAPATETLRAGSASYTLTVFGKYVLVTSEPASWEGEYLIVSAASGTAYAFDYSKASGSSASGYEVSIVDGAIKSDSEIELCAVTVSKYGDAHAAETNHAAYDIKVQSSSKPYLFRYGSTTTLLQEDSETGSGSSARQNQHTLVYDTATNSVRMMYAGNKAEANKYFFYFNSSNKFTYSDKVEYDTYSADGYVENSSAYRVYFFKKAE